MNIRSTSLTLAIIFRQQRANRSVYWGGGYWEFCNKMMRQRGKKQDRVWVTQIYRQQNHASTEWLQYKHWNNGAEAIFVTVGQTAILTTLIWISFFVVVLLLLWLKQGRNMAGNSHLWGRVHYFEPWGGQSMSFRQQESVFLGTNAKIKKTRDKNKSAI